MLTTAELALARHRDVSALNAVLPVIGGTVTEVVEHVLGEPLHAVRLSQRTRTCTRPLEDLDLHVGQSLLERRVVLHGTFTSRPVFCAESLIALDRLEPTIRDGLLTTDQPIGRLIRSHRLETFRELLTYERLRVPEVARELQLPAYAWLLARTYRVSAAGAPLMLITEWFPC
jgi:chorismate-pyruvate lyase